MTVTQTAGDGLPIAASAPVSFAVATQVGSGIIVEVNSRHSTAVVSVADDAGNIYTQVVDVAINASATPQRIYNFYCPASSCAPATTITVSQTELANIIVRINEIPDLGAFIDSNPVVSTDVAAAPVTTTGAAHIRSSIAVSATNRTYNAQAAGWTNEDMLIESGNTCLDTAWVDETSAGTFDPQWARTGGTIAGCCILTSSWSTEAAGPIRRLTIVP